MDSVMQIQTQGRDNRLEKLRLLIGMFLGMDRDGFVLAEEKPYRAKLRNESRGLTLYIDLGDPERQSVFSEQFSLFRDEYDDPMVTTSSPALIHQFIYDSTEDGQRSLANMIRDSAAKFNDLLRRARAIDVSIEATYTDDGLWIDRIRKVL